MFFEYYYPNKKDAVLIHIQGQEDNGLLVTYINGFKSKYIISKTETYRLKNILENNHPTESQKSWFEENN